MTSGLLKEQIKANLVDQDKAGILALIESAEKARYEKDVHAIASTYRPGAAIFSLAPPLVHRGVDIGEMQAWLDSWDGPIKIESHDFDITVAGDSAFCYGYMRMSGQKKGAGQPISFWMRETLCLVREKDTWRIVHEHTSVPFYMDDSLRPAFDLEPDGKVPSR